MFLLDRRALNTKRLALISDLCSRMEMSRVFKSHMTTLSSHNESAPAHEPLAKAMRKVRILPIREFDVRKCPELSCLQLNHPVAEYW
jgi:hypothetical protein